MRAPEAPIGWPSAIAPPLTLTFSGSTPRSAVDARPTAANASLIRRGRTNRLRLPRAPPLPRMDCDG